MPAAETNIPHEYNVDFSTTAGVFRPLHGVNNGPVSTRGGPDLTRYFKEAAIPSCRLHDVPHAGSHAVDIPTIFPLADADPDDPRNYRFDRTDDYIQGIVDAGARIVYWLGTSIEHSKRKYDVNPPADYDRWAKVCVNIIRHYNDGWANGFRHGIREWEIWNEPDIGHTMWTGTDEEYFRLYIVTSKAIKAYNPDLNVGGPGLAGNMTFLKNFLAACRDEEAPLDFMSWHQYTADPYSVVDRAGKMQNVLDEFGFTRTDSHLNEWHFFNADWKKLRADPSYAKTAFEDLNGTRGAAFAGATLLLLQDTSVDTANYYTGDTSRWGLFDPAGRPHKTYFAFRAFREMLHTPKRVACTRVGEARGPVVGAGTSETETSANILICNLGGGGTNVRINLHHLPWDGSSDLEIIGLDPENDFESLGLQQLDAGAKQLDLVCPSPGIRLIRLNKTDSSD